MWHVLMLQEKYGDVYTQKNLAISGIHTHAAPAGYLQYVLYQITSLGFVKQTYDGMVEGIVKVGSPQAWLPKSIELDSDKKL